MTSATDGPSRAGSMPVRRANSATSTTRKATSIGGEVVILVLDLRLGKRRATVQAPVHRLRAAIEMAVADDLAEGADLLRLVAGSMVR